MAEIVGAIPARNLNRYTPMAWCLPEKQRQVYSFVGELLASAVEEFGSDAADMMNGFIVEFTDGQKIGFPYVVSNSLHTLEEVA